LYVAFISQKKYLFTQTLKPFFGYKSKTKNKIMSNELKLE